MKVFAFLPAKGTSERIENKNKKFLDGERLYIRGLKILLACRNINQVYLDTEDDNMYDMVKYLPVEFMKRDPQFASNATDGNGMFLNEVKSFPDADIYVQLLCTSPFIKPETVDKAIQILIENPEYDSVVLMKKDKQYLWDENGPLYNKNKIPNSFTLPDTIIESMGLYVMRKEAALKTSRRFGDKPYLLFGDVLELIDVNLPEEFELAETISKGLKQREQEKLNLIKHFVSSPMLSDLLDDLKEDKNINAGGVITNLVPNIPNSKIFGYAKTLKLRKIKEGEDFKGIYDALGSYETLSQGDIIVVENEMAEYAYFGDLNARLAIKNGAQGVIVGGVTRDVERVKQLGVPVFAKGRNAKDVRRKATVEHINQPIQIDGVDVQPNDLIFADNDAVLVIHSQYKDLVIQTALETVQREGNIISDMLNSHPEDLVKKHGAF